MTHDEEAWLDSVRRHIDAAKIAVQSNKRIDEMTLADLASQLETIFKDCRSLVKEDE